MRIAVSIRRGDRARGFQQRLQGKFDEQASEHAWRRRIERTDEPAADQSRED